MGRARAGVGREGADHAGGARADADLRIGLINRIDQAIEAVAPIVGPYGDAQLSGREVEQLALQVGLDDVLRLVQRVVVLVLQVVPAILADAGRIDERRDAAGAGACAIVEVGAVVRRQQQFLPAPPVDVALLAHAIDAGGAVRRVDVPGPAAGADGPLHPHQGLVDVRGVSGGGDAEEADRGRIVPGRHRVRSGEEFGQQRGRDGVGGVERDWNRPEVRGGQWDVDVVHVVVAVDQLSVGGHVVGDLVFEPRKARITLHRSRGGLVVVGVVLDAVGEGVVGIRRIVARGVSRAGGDVEEASPVAVDAVVDRSGGREAWPVGDRRPRNGIEFGLIVAEVQEAQGEGARARRQFALIERNVALQGGRAIEIVEGDHHVAAAIGEIGARGDRVVGIAVVAATRDSALCVDLQPLEIVLQLEVHHPGHRVRAIDRRSATGDHLHAVHQGARDRVDVHGEAGSGRLHPPPVEQHQIAGGAQVAEVQRRRPGLPKARARLGLAGNPGHLRQLLAKSLVQRGGGEVLQRLLRHGDDRALGDVVATGDARAGDHHLADLRRLGARRRRRWRLLGQGGRRNGGEGGGACGGEGGSLDARVADGHVGSSLGVPTCAVTATICAAIRMHDQSMSLPFRI